VVAVYSTFLQRAYDEILHDVALQNLNVTFCLDRAGAVGADGVTHQGLYDLSYLSSMPNMTVLAPRSTEELKRMLAYAAEKPSPVAIRYPNGEEECSLPSDGGVEANYPTPVQIARLDGPWTVDFLDKVRGPKEPVVFEALTDWTTNSDDLIKYYSGTAVYKSSFKLDTAPDGNHILIDLGDFVAMARVKVNGQDAGGLWTAPYTLDITDLVKAGDNEVEIEVVNTWLNRLIGDLNLPEAKRTTWAAINSWKADSPLQKAGLFGPVVIESVDYAE